MSELPHNPSFENAVIGSILYDNTQYHRVRDLLSPEDFYTPANAVIWQVMTDLLGSGKAADPLMVRETLERNGQLEEAGGPDWLAECYESAAFGPEIGDYGRIVADAALRRRAIQAGNALSVDAASGKIEDVIDEHDRALEALRNRATGESNTADLQEQTIARLVDPKASADRLIPTGFPSIDEHIGGFQRGTFSVIGARPGMGKSALGICLLGNQARMGHTAGFFSLEMPDTDVGIRLGCWEAHQTGSRVPWYSDVMLGRAEPRHIEAVQSAMGMPHIRQVLVDDRASLKVSAMKRQYRYWQRQCRMKGIEPPSVVYVDHVGHVRPDEDTRGRYERLTSVSNALLAFAKEFDIAVVGLSQLSRASVEGKEVPTPPGLHHLKDSGALEEDATLVMFLHRPDYYLRKMAEAGVDGATDQLRNEQGNLSVIIEKARNGRPGTVRLRHRIENNVFLDPKQQEGRAAV